MSIPRWATEDNISISLPNLVKIALINCHGLHQLPSLAKLRRLKSLQVLNLKSLEYMEDDRSSGTGSSSYGAVVAAAIADTTSDSTERTRQVTESFFPSLEELELRDLPKLKAWWRPCLTSSQSRLNLRELQEDDDDNQLGNNDICVQPDPLSSFPVLSKLIITGCPNLMSIPPCPALETLCLSKFNKRLKIIVSQKEVNVRCDAGSESLTALRSIGGPLTVRVSETRMRILWEPDSNNIRIHWELGTASTRRADYERVLLENLKPHHQLRGAEIEGYDEVLIPRWARGDKLATFLPNLVKISLVNCHGVRDLPWLCKLLYLKTLLVINLSNLEYMETPRTSTSSASNSSGYRMATSKSREEAIESVFFPSLEALELGELPKLKGWWRKRGLVVRDDQVIDCSSQTCRPTHSFPRLSKLTVKECPQLTLFPLCPTVETLLLIGVSKTLGRIVKHERRNRVVSIKIVDDHRMVDEIDIGEAEKLDAIKMEVNIDNEDGGPREISTMTPAP